MTHIEPAPTPGTTSKSITAHGSLRRPSWPCLMTSTPQVLLNHCFIGSLEAGRCTPVEWSGLLGRAFTTGCDIDFDELGSFYWCTTTLVLGCVTKEKHLYESTADRRKADWEQGKGSNPGNGGDDATRRRRGRRSCLVGRDCRLHQSSHPVSSRPCFLHSRAFLPASSYC